MRLEKVSSNLEFAFGVVTSSIATAQPPQVPSIFGNDMQESLQGCQIGQVDRTSKPQRIAVAIMSGGVVITHCEFGVTARFKLAVRTFQESGFYLVLYQRPRAPMSTQRKYYQKIH